MRNMILVTIAVVLAASFLVAQSMAPARAEAHTIRSTVCYQAASRYPYQSYYWKVRFNRCMAWAKGHNLSHQSPPAAKYQSAVASAYGPGLYGNRTACGQTLHPGTIGVAHKSMTCGTRLEFRINGRSVIVSVIDRGPYSGNRTFDLTEAAVRKLGFGSATAWGVRTVQWRPVR